jgi:pimeloyl-ACP methyl ester carboxylesterase
MKPVTESRSAVGEECWAAVEGHRMRYLRAGSGPPLVLIHGLLGYAFSWRMNLEALAQQATVYAVDLLGTGFSERPSMLDCSQRASAGRMLKFMDAVGLQAADVLGTSHGGALAIMLAAQAPQRVRRLVLVAPANPWSSHGKWLIRFFKGKTGGTLLRSVTPVARVRFQILRRLYGDPARIAPGTLQGYSAPLRVPGAIDYLVKVLRCWEGDMGQVEAALPRIAHIPTLLLWGSKDAAVLPGSAPRLKAQFQHAELVLLDGVGHLPYEEAPEEFNRVVGRFLANLVIR